MQRRVGNVIVFDDTFMDCSVHSLGNSFQLAHQRKLQNADIKAPFQLVYGNPMESFRWQVDLVVHISLEYLYLRNVYL